MKRVAIRTGIVAGAVVAGIATKDPLIIITIIGAGFAATEGIGLIVEIFSGMTAAERSAVRKLIGIPDIPPIMAPAPSGESGYALSPIGPFEIAGICKGRNAKKIAGACIEHGDPAFAFGIRSSKGKIGGMAIIHGAKASGTGDMPCYSASIVSDDKIIDTIGKALIGKYMADIIGVEGEPEIRSISIAKPIDPELATG